ncbi:two-component regulator propeller domain-containing protein [Hugenholtzia roseola]|uniref:two-component regulator propeller domain-containing protein n=1 Tax=Hugenholtzia roseola TaxID=1002 RepID=UPI00041EBDDA|nr:two-component regulator propeller domain-containing protein [Hugenholtzia roseola]
MKRLLQWLLLFFFIFGIGVPCCLTNKGFHFFPTLQAQGIEAKTQEAFNPTKKLSQFPIEYWTSEKGLPIGTLLHLTQTREGYIWICSYDGLIRFDGMYFELFNKSNQAAFLTNNIVRLAHDPFFVAQEERLWIGTQGSGLIKYEKGVFTRLGLEAQYIESLCQTHPDSLWIGTRSSGLFLYHLPSQNFQRFRPDIFPDHQTIYDLLHAKDGSLWIGLQNNGVWRKAAQELTKVESKQPESPHIRPIRLYQDTQGQMWVGTQKGVFKWNQSQQQWEGLFPQLQNERIHDLLHDKVGNLWIVTRARILRHNQLSDSLEVLTTELGDDFDDVRNIYLDNEKNLWIPTSRHGLACLRDSPFWNFTKREGIAHKAVYSVAEAPQKKVLVGTSNGFLHLIDPEKNSISEIKLKTPIKGNEIFNLRYDKSGRLWVATYIGLIVKNPDGSEKLYTESTGLPTNLIRFVYEDQKGQIWLGTRGKGLILCKPKAGQEWSFETKTEIAKAQLDFVMAITEDKQGRLLIASNNGGWGRYDATSGNLEIFDTDKGMPANLVFNFHIDTQGIIWIATNAGLVRYDGTKFFTYTHFEGLLHESLFDVIEDSLGNFWFPTNNGILRASREDLEAVAKGEKARVFWKKYDKQDGMASEQCRGATKSLLTSWGEVWIPTHGGALAFNPLAMQPNIYQPPLYIRRIDIGKEQTLSPEQITLQAEGQRILIDFTALSFRAPEKMRFRYRLVGFEKEWVETTSEQRQAVYTNLPPNRYTFEVMASNSEGFWNDEKVTLPIVVEPQFYQTWWFALCVVGALGLLLWQIWLWRIRKIKARAVELEEIVLERTTELRTINEEIEAQKAVLDERNQVIEKQNENIISSINYAKRIQDAMLPTESRFQELLPKSFVFFRPRDIVSGDFYWIGEKEDKVILVAADCTGHGVPGAFMSLIGNDMLNKIILDQHQTEPALILNQLHKEVNAILKQNQTDNRDGMDIAICVWDKQAGQLHFAGAQNPLIYVEQGQIHEIKGDLYPIGGGQGFRKKESESFSYQQHTISVQKPLMLYLFSDGYQDQFGGKNDKKFMKRNLRNLLHQIHALPVAEQALIIAQTFDKWKGFNPQIDDVLVVGVRLEAPTA